MKKIISYIGMLLPALLFLVGCTDIDDFALAQRELTLTATMPADKVVTRVNLETQDYSKNLSAKWRENDKVQVFITQGDDKYEIGNVQVTNISEERNRADITIKLPDALDIEQEYTVYAFTGIEGELRPAGNGVWHPRCTAEMKRMWLRHFVDIPLFCQVETKGVKDVKLLFQHFGTYELLHLTNATSELISFRHDGFESEDDKWYWKQATIVLDFGTIMYGSFGETEDSKEQTIHAGHTGDYISWYLPSGRKLNKARLKANIDGQEVTSENTKTSDVTVECGHVYHLYATWNGQELRFDNGDFVESRTYTLSREEIDFGKTKVGETHHDYFNIQNTGNVPQTFIVEATHGEFEIEKSGKKIELQPNESEAIGVDFKPEQYDHNYQQTVHITCEGAEGPQYIVLKGQSEAKPEETRTYTVTPETLDFGSTVVGTTYSQTFSIKNTGNVPLQFFIEATHEEFEIQQSGAMLEVKPNESQTIIVVFKPQNYDTTYQKEVTIFCYDAQGPKKIVLTAQTRVQETLSYIVAPQEIDFGTVEVGTTQEKSFGIKNTGNVPLSFYLTPTHGDFEIEESGLSFRLAPDEAKIFKVAFTPTEFDKDYVKEITIQCSSAEADGPKSVTLKGHTETRIDQVIPPDIREKLEDHITIYEGVNPPNVEGQYLVSPFNLSFDSDNNWNGEHTFADCYMKFYNQDSRKNMIDFYSKCGSGETIGEGAFISGEGNNFSIFFNTKGISRFDAYDVNTREALIISGTITSDGIRNLEYAFVMVDKSNDPNKYIMNIGQFRSIIDGDGFSERTTWTSAVKAMKAKATQRGGSPLLDNCVAVPRKQTSSLFRNSIKVL